MTPAPKRVLFVPASGPTGSGEYFRALALAAALRRIAPAIETHVVRSGLARIDDSSGVIVHPLEDTPSRAGHEMLALIERLRPTLAVFDGSGRSAQLRAVRRLGGRVAWVSNRPSRRRRALAWWRLRWIDLHLLLGAEAAHASLRGWDRWRARRYPTTRHRFARAILPASNGQAVSLPDSIRALLEPSPAVFVSGGGGQRTPDGTPVPDLFATAAERFHQRTGCPALVVLGPQYAGARVTESGGQSGVTILRSLPSEQLGVVLGRAGLIVAGAGNMLSNQVVHAARPCVMTATGSHDQPARLADYAARGAVHPAVLEAEALAEAAVALHEDGVLQGALVEGLAALDFEDDTERVANWLAELAGLR
jgi:hypothetical protein